MASKHRYTATQVEKALHETRGMIFLAAERLGCAHNTVLNYVSKHPYLQDVINSYRGRLIDTAELRLVQAVNQGTEWGVKFCLATIGKDRGYQPTVVQEQHHSGTIMLSLEQRLQLAHSQVEVQREASPKLLTAPTTNGHTGPAGGRNGTAH
jgi:hypothetical protein